MTTTSIVGEMREVQAIGGMARGLWPWLGILAICTGCHTERAASVAGVVPGNRLLAQLEPGVIVLTAQPQPAAIRFDAPNTRVESASEGAGTAVRRVWDTPSLGNAQLEAVVGVAEFAVTPFAAAYGAVRSSRQRLDPEKLSQAEQSLVQAMRCNADSAMLRDKVAEAARQRSSRLLVCAASVADAPANRLPVSAVLELGVEQLRLQAEESEHRFYVAVRARLLRRPDGTVLLDRPYYYTSGPALFVDWTRKGGLEGVAQTGYQSLAEEIARDVFQFASEPPLLIGPGHPHSIRLRSWHLTWRAGGRLDPVSCRPACDWPLQRSARPRPHPPKGGRGRAKAPVVLCQVPPLAPRGHSPTARDGNSAQAGVPPQEGPTDVGRPAVPRAAATIEVYSERPGALLRAPKAGPVVEDATNPQTDAEYALDGMENDRNAVVQFAACLGAVPMGLWEQTVGVGLKSWRHKRETLAAGLEARPEQEHFAEALADEVARQLRSQGLNQVLRAEAPPRFTLAVPGQEKAPVAVSSAGTNTQLMLRLQVLNARLLGPHRNSRSRALCVEVQAVVLRAADGQELYSRPICYRSSSKRLKEWAATDAKLLREELAACSRQTAQAVAQELGAQGFVTK